MGNCRHHPIAILTIDLAKLLQDSVDIQYIQQLCIQKVENDLASLTWNFIDWLLIDPTHGLINITGNEGVKASIAMTSSDVVKPQANGSAVTAEAMAAVMLSTELTKARAWGVYKYAALTQSDRRQKRAEWMIAAATFNAAQATNYGALAGAVHAAAVAWSASRAVAFYESALAKLLTLIGHDIEVNDRVKMDATVCGQHTGVVKGILTGNGKPTTAIVNIDHTLSGIYWHGPVDRLKKAIEA